MSIRTLGVDLGIRAAHVATLCDSGGEVVWSKRRFGNRHDRVRNAGQPDRGMRRVDGGDGTHPQRVGAGGGPFHGGGAHQS